MTETNNGVHFWCTTAKRKTQKKEKKKKKKKERQKNEPTKFFERIFVVSVSFPDNRLPKMLSLGKLFEYSFSLKLLERMKTFLLFVSCFSKSLFKFGLMKKSLLKKKIEKSQKRREVQPIKPSTPAKLVS